MPQMVHRFLAFMLIIAGALIVYGQTVHYTFHFDDYYFITENLKIRDITDFKDVWNSLGKPSRLVGMYSFALNYHVHQNAVFGYHLVNILIHIINGYLVWWLVLLTLKPAPGKDDRRELIALATALMFVCHPLNTQAVTYISQRFASLATLFYLAALCLYIQGRLLTGGKRTIAFVFSLLAAVLGMFTKQIVLTLPVMILLYEYCFRGEGKKLKVIRWPLALVLLALFLVVPTLHSWDFSRLFDVRIESRSHDGDIITSYNYMLTQFRVIPTYIRLLFFPVGQTLDYDFTVSNRFWVWPVWGGMLFILSIIVYGVFSLKRRVCIGFGILWFFLTLSIESTFIPIYQVIFEHRCYLPGVGFLFALNMFLSDQLKSRRKYLVSIGLIIAVLAWAAHKRNQVWENETTLWQDIKLKATGKLRPYIHLGVSYIMKGEYDSALNEFNQALLIRDDDFKVYHNRGIVYDMKGDYKNALDDYTKAIALNDRAAVSYSNRANILVRLKEYNKAFRDYSKAIETGAYPDAYQGRGNLYFMAGRYEEALKDFLRAKELGSPIDDRDIEKVKKLIR